MPTHSGNQADWRQVQPCRGALEAAQRSVFGPSITVRAQLRAGWVHEAMVGGGEHLHEGVVALQLGHHLRPLCPHLDRILDRAFGLFLERGRAAVPELRELPAGVEGGGRVDAADLTANALGIAQLIGAALLQVVAAGARDRVVALRGR